MPSRHTSFFQFTRALPPSPQQRATTSPAWRSLPRPTPGPASPRRVSLPGGASSPALLDLTLPITLPPLPFPRESPPARDPQLPFSLSSRLFHRSCETLGLGTDLAAILKDRAVGQQVSGRSSLSSVDQVDFLPIRRSNAQSADRESTTSSKSAPASPPGKSPPPPLRKSLRREARQHRCWILSRNLVSRAIAVMAMVTATVTAREISMGTTGLRAHRRAREGLR